VFDMAARRREQGGQGELDRAFPPNSLLPPNHQLPIESIQLRCRHDIILTQTDTPAGRLRAVQPVHDPARLDRTRQACQSRPCEGDGPQSGGSSRQRERQREGGKVSVGLLARQSCSVDIRGKSAIGGERYGRGRGKERKAHVLVRVWEESFDQALIVCYEAPSYRPRHSPNLLPTIPTRLADPPLLPLPLISPQEIFNSPTASHAYKSNAEPVPTPTAGHPILPSDLPSKEDAPTLHVRLPPAYLVHLSIHARFPTL
jgi:hypothetical protein